MAGRGEQLDAWLLHSRPFRETSLLLDLLTLEHGRLSAVARGARSSKGRQRVLLQPFVALRITVSGNNELRTLHAAEVAAPAPRLQGERLIAGLYLNELLVKLLQGHEPEPRVFHAYAQTLASLGAGGEVEPLLRNFELCLLESLGYGLQFEQDADSGEVLEPDAWYYLQAGSGFVRQLQAPADEAAARQAGLYPGVVLLDMAAGDFSAAGTRRHAKRLLRQVLQQHLDGKEIVSRRLFSQMQKGG